jgi:cysteinyl-tRNA synthetase
LEIKNISRWAYQIQSLNQAGAIDALMASHYDMLVIEPTRTDWGSGEQGFNTRSMVTRLKNSLASDGSRRKLVIAYINIGQAENWRWYWQWSTSYNCKSNLPNDWPDFILACDPDGWAGDYPVAYWDVRWKDIVIYGNNQGEDPSRDYRSIIDEVIIDGFDGVYLDWVEGYENEQVIDAAKANEKDPAGEMVQLIQNIKDYAISRRPGFIIIQQNAATLIQEHSELFEIIDAIAQEGVWYSGEATDQWDDPLGYDQEEDPTLTDEYIELLTSYQEAGLPVFVCEYALLQADIAYKNAYDQGYIPYVTRTPLSRLTTTLAPNK